MSYRDRQNARDREYLAAWENLTPSQRRELEQAGVGGPLLYRDHEGPRGDDDDFDPIENASAVPAGEVESSALADATLRILYLLTQSRHPRLRLAAEILAAIVGRTDEKSQASIARRYRLTRAAVNKHFQTMRRSPHLAGLEIYLFGGRAEASEAARKRALRVHSQRKQLCKQQTQKLPSLLQQLQTAQAA